jgi:hypothetical protein
MLGRYDNPIQTRFLAPIDCSKITALLSLMRAGNRIEEENKGFFCSATKFALKEEKIAAQLFRNKLVEEGNQEKSRVLSH